MTSYKIVKPQFTIEQKKVNRGTVLRLTGFNFEDDNISTDWVLVAYNKDKTINKKWLIGQIKKFRALYNKSTILGLRSPAGCTYQTLTPTTGHFEYKRTV